LTIEFNILIRSLKTTLNQK